MYCVKCGVELGASEKKCPLCGTPAFHPDMKIQNGEPPYPTARSGAEEVSRSGALFIVTVLAALPAVLLILCDWWINGRIVWSGYASGGITLAYIVIVLPLWFRRPNPVIFVPVDFIAVGLYLLYIDLSVHGGWFLSFAFPVTGGAAVIVCTVVALCRYIRRGYLFIFGGALILSGGMMVLLEFLISLTFGTKEIIYWSVFPLAACSVLGIMLIIIGACRPLRESLHKKFFI